MLKLYRSGPWYVLTHAVSYMKASCVVCPCFSTGASSVFACQGVSWSGCLSQALGWRAHSRLGHTRFHLDAQCLLLFAAAHVPKSVSTSSWLCMQTLQDMLSASQQDLEAFLTQVYRAIAGAAPLKDKVRPLLIMPNYLLVQDKRLELVWLLSTASHTF